MESNIIKQFNLPNYIKGKTFAEASKLIENKFKDKQDKTSLETKGEFMSRLAEAQEYIKTKNNLSNIGNTEEFFFGGDMENEEIDPIKASIAGAGELFNVGNNLFGNTGVQTDGSQSYDKVNGAQSAMSGALSGASAGMALGPLGAIGGGLVGGLSSLLGAGRKNKDIREANTNNTLAKTADLRSDFKYGGSVNKYTGGGSLDEIFKAQGELFNSPQLSTFNPSMAAPKTAQDRPVNRFNDATDWLGQNAGNIASLAPLFGSLTNKVKLESTGRGSRVRNTYDKNLFDEQALVNQVNQNDVNSALTQSSGGDLGALRSNILAANLNKTKALSDGMLKGQQINREEDRYAYQTGLNRDMFNVQLDDKYVDRAAQDKGAFNTAKSNLRTALYEDIGALGRETVDKKLVRDMFGYKWDGRYFVDKSGKKYSQKDVAKMVQDKKKETE